VPSTATPPDVTGVHGEVVEVWRLDDVVGVLRSPCPETQLQPRRAHLQAHDRVLAAAMADGPVLPFRFGVVAEVDAGEVLAGLDTDAVQRRWHRLDGHVEVQLIWELDEEMALRRIAARDPSIAHRAAPAIDRGRAIADHMVALAADDMERLLGRLGPNVVGRGRVEPRGTAASRAPVLVPAADLEEVLGVCDELAREVAGAGILRHVAGLPPYSFADLDDDLLTEVG
jgi:hypothetical protein